MRTVGERIGAIYGSSAGTIEFLGYGVYAGDEVPVTAIGPLAEMCREVACDNPKLVLDDGSVVWGCECWWGSEESVQQRLAGCDHVVVVKIEDKRQQYREAKK